MLLELGMNHCVSVGDGLTSPSGSCFETSHSGVTGFHGHVKRCERKTTTRIMVMTWHSYERHERFGQETRNMRYKK